MLQRFQGTHTQYILEVHFEKTNAFFFKLESHPIFCDVING